VVNITQAARLLGVSYFRVYRAARANRVPCLKIGSVRLFDTEQLVALQTFFSRPLESHADRVTGEDTQNQRRG
jgi:excisionase family DNA binding protein